MTKLQKILSTMFVIAMLVTTGAVMAQDDETTTPNTAFCAPERSEDGERENPVHVALEELGITREDVRAYIEAGGTIEEFFAENGIDIEAIREAQQAEQQATLLSCIDEAEADGLISAEQANQLSEAIAEGTLRELVQSGEFEGLFPRGEGQHGGRNGFGDGEGRRGNGFGDADGEGRHGPRRGGRGGNGFGGNGADTNGS